MHSLQAECSRLHRQVFAAPSQHELELVRDQLGDLVAEGFDIAVRFGQPPSSSLVARRLLDTRTVTVASPDYLKRRGRPNAPGDLAGHSCIQMKSAMTGLPLDWE